MSEPQGREERAAVFKYPIWIQVSREVLADTARTWQERFVILGASDPNPFPRFRLFRWFP